MSNDVSIPQRGDLIWTDSEPHAGHEYAGQIHRLVTHFSQC